MSFELPTPSPLGTYDRNKLFLVTFPDGTQKFYPRATKSARGQITPLSWWKKCGIFTDERDLWSKSIMYPEHAQIMKRAGIAPTDLFNTLLSPSQTEDVMTWLNVYRISYGRTPKSLREFDDFVRKVEDCGEGEKNPVALGRYVAKLTPYRLGFNDFVFAIGNDSWLDAICLALDPVPDNRYLSATVKTLMQVGATPDAVAAVAVPLHGMRTDHYAIDAAEATRHMFMAGEFAATAESYGDTRLLAESLYAARYSRECAEYVKELFFTAGTDRQRLRDLTVVEGITDRTKLIAIFKEEVPTALVGGVL